MSNWITNVYWIVLELILVYSSIGVLVTNSPVYSICYLISCFSTSTILIIYMGAELLALIFIMIYVGAISVLFVFVIMMLNLKKMEKYLSLKLSYIKLVYCFTGLLVYYIIIWLFYKFLFIKNNFLIKIQEMNYNYYFPTTYSKEILNKISNILSVKKSIQYYSDILYIDKFLIFWIGGMLLLLAMVGAIIISLNKSLSIYRQNSFSQITKNEKTALFLFKKSIIKIIFINWINMKLNKLKKIND